MRPLPVEPFIKVYMLLCQNGTYLNVTGFDPNGGIGSGFFITRGDAEMYRTKELLGQKTDSTNKYHIYEIEIPNPAYTE